MNRFFLLALPLVFVAVNGQLLTLEQKPLIKGLVPADIHKVLSQLSDEQKKLLLKADVDHNLGSNSIIVANRLLDSYEKLTPDAQGLARTVVLSLNSATKENAKDVLNKLKEQYKKLDDASKKSLKDNFANIAKALE